MNDLHPDPNGVHARLVVYLHGFRTQVGADHPMGRALRDLVPDADLYLPALPHRKLFANERLAVRAARLLDALDELCRARDYEEILLVGHSTGAVLARKLFVCAHGEVERGGRVEAPFEPPLDAYREPRAWAGRVRRIVLLAAMSRGWDVGGVTSRWQALQWSLGAFYGHAKLGPLPTIFDIRRGAPFVVQTRLQWLALMRSARKPDDVLVVQLLGTTDDLVAPSDNLDFAVDQGDVFFALVPNSGHTTIVKVAASDEEEGPPAKRRERLRMALRASRDELEHSATSPALLSDQLPPAPDTTVRAAVFVIHGIRDLGHWSQKIAAEVKRVAAEERIPMRSLTPSYGFFAMAPFLFPWVRRGKVEWLMDRYVEARAMYPDAGFSYVGHSNGTYLLARALEDYPACRVQRVVFAGSVVRADYDWLALLDTGRVERVLNYVATADWVVAAIPHGLRLLRAFDLGGAGHTGFDQGDDARIGNVRYVKGAHSAGLVESQWDEIADFVTRGRFPEGPNPDYAERQEESIQTLGSLSPLLLTVALLVLVGGVGWLLQRTLSEEHLVGAAWAFASVGVIGALRIVFTKV